MTIKSPIKVSDRDGDNLIEFSDYTKWASSRYVNEAGEFSIELPESHRAFELFANLPEHLDYIIEFESNNCACKHTFLLQGRSLSYDDAGCVIVNATGSDGKALLIRAHNKYNSGTTQAQPNSYMDAIAHQMVRQNASVDATRSNDRWANGVRNGMQPSYGSNVGVFLASDFSGENLYQMLTDFGASSDFYWDMVYQGGGEWALQTWWGLRGKNRSNTGYNRDTLKNAYGETPVILDATLGKHSNIFNVKMEIDYTDHVNAVCAIGETTTEPVQQIRCFEENKATSQMGRWARRETVLLGAGSTKAEVETQAKLELERSNVSEILTLEWRNNDDTIYTYCDDFGLGDVVTVCAFGRTVDVEITGEEIIVDKSGETIRPILRNTRQDIVDYNIDILNQRLKRLERGIMRVALT